LSVETRAANEEEISISQAAVHCHDIVSHRFGSGRHPQRIAAPTIWDRTNIGGSTTKRSFACAVRFISQCQAGKLSNSGSRQYSSSPLQLLRIEPLLSPA
jgi:hypothetical protein